MLSGYHFQFRLVLTICTALALGVLISLGAWQLHRLEWKRDLITKVEARVNAAPIAFADAVRRADVGEDMEYTPVIVSGTFPPTKTALVFGAMGATPGTYSFAPFETRDGVVVYINRGFTPQAVNDTSLDSDGSAFDIGTKIIGLFRSPEYPSPPASWFRPTEQSVDGLWYVRDPARFANAAGIKAEHYYIDQFAVAGREWPKGGTTRLEFNNRHREYALTWFGLALTLVGVWLAFSLQKRQD